MPFVSKAQQRFAFATDQPWAKKWAKATNFRTLPSRVMRRGPKPKRVANKIGR